ncbi:hypothetical protein Scep_019936 [Stephania cephalantha]|uniref:Uncharacterized protein n=1 Tax=Stephania cephalantha TaxID=152367 RepID=A0AAP0NLW8_9MAGN
MYLKMRIITSRGESPRIKMRCAIWRSLFIVRLKLSFLIWTLLSILLQLGLLAALPSCERPLFTSTKDLHKEHICSTIEVH